MPNDVYQQVTEETGPERYIIDITEPEQIPAVVIESEKRARETGTPQEYMLNHIEEPNAVRGYSQPLDGGIRRPDGGLTWYHNKTGCLNRAYPLPDVDKRGQQQEAWGETAASIIAAAEANDEHGYTWQDADIYTDEGQIAGTSAANRNGIRIERACWYEDHPRDEAFDTLLEDDTVDIDAFYDVLVVPNDSIIDHLAEKHEYEHIGEEEITGFISAESEARMKALQEHETGERRGSCLLGPTSEDT